MKRRFSEEQIIRILKEAEIGGNPKQAARQPRLLSERAHPVPGKLPVSTLGHVTWLFSLPDGTHKH